jgi:hypothetical protein
MFSSQKLKYQLQINRVQSVCDLRGLITFNNKKVNYLINYQITTKTITYEKSRFNGCNCASLTLFAACSGNSKQGTSDSSSVSQDSSGSNGGAGTGSDSVTTVATSQAATAAGDTSGNKRDTATSTNTPKP